MNSKLLTLTGALALICICSLPAADAIKYQAKPTGSEMRLDGDCPLHKWTCISQIISGSFEVEPAWQKDPSLKSVTCLGPGKTPPKCEVKVPVRSLKSQVLAGRDTMDNRLRAEMKAKTFLTIDYRLTEMAIKGEVPVSGSPVTFDTKGHLMVCGTTNRVSFPVTMERVGADTLKFTGTLETKMTACGITPPEFNLVVSSIKTADAIKLTWTWLVTLKKD